MYNHFVLKSEDSSSSQLRRTDSAEIRNKCLTIRCQGVSQPGGSHIPATMDATERNVIWFGTIISISSKDKFESRGRTVVLLVLFFLKVIFTLYFKVSFFGFQIIPITGTVFISPICWEIASGGLYNDCANPFMIKPRGDNLSNNFFFIISMSSIVTELKNPSSTYIFSLKRE